MWLLSYGEDAKFELSFHSDDEPPPYAILSHTWSVNSNDEVSYQDIVTGDRTKDLFKLNFCKEQAAKDGYKYFWIDTCCINKRDDAEVAYAIRSMWRYYSNAGVCYVYLSDVSVNKRRDDEPCWQDTFKGSRWFTRGWTLQELLAPKDVQFFARDGDLGSKRKLSPLISSIPGMQQTMFDRSIDNIDYHTRLSWINNRTTTRGEDLAYCMMGICDVVFDPRYGEGKSEARRRLKAAITEKHGPRSLGFELEPSDSNLRSDQQREKHRESMLDLLNFNAMESRRMTIKRALETTCRWILSDPVYTDWRNPETSHKHSGFMWLKGKPGAGKSVLVKFLDQHITKNKEKHDIRLSFYFNARGDALEKSFLGLYRSLLVQLIGPDRELWNVLDRLKLTQSPEDTPLDLLQQAFSAALCRCTGKRIFCFIDALDECEEDDVKSMIDHLKDLHEDAWETGVSLYVCFASRLYPIQDISTELQLPLEERREHEEDLRRYVQKNLCESTPRMEQIRNDVVTKANGIFLWTILVVNILKKEILNGRVHYLESRLRETPGDLEKLFRHILQRDSSNLDEFKLCLRWILYAQRPLELPEFYVAMMAGSEAPVDLQYFPKDLSWDTMHRYLVSSSKGFAELTRGKAKTVQFIHESVREFLHQDQEFQQLYGPKTSCLDDGAHEQLKTCCLRGLTIDWDGTSTSRSRSNNRTRSRRPPFAEYAVKNILYHADHAASSIPQGKFIREELNFPLWRTRMNTFKKGKVNQFTEDTTLLYVCADQNLGRLARAACDMSPLEKTSSPFCSPVHRHENSRYKTPLLAAIQLRKWDAVVALLQIDGASKTSEIVAELAADTPRLDHVDPTDLTRPWVLAKQFSSKLFALYILRTMPTAQLAQSFHADMHKSNWLGWCKDAIVEYLAEMIGEVSDTMLEETSSPDRMGVTKLVLAIQLGRESMVADLLDQGADSNRLVNSRSPLFYACLEGHLGIARRLLDSGASVNSRDEATGSTSLMAAVLCDSATCVELLLEKGADVHISDNENHTALSHAICRDRDLVIIRSLIEHGAKIEAGSYYHGQSGLHSACQSFWGDFELIKLLVAHGAVIDARDDQGFTPLLISCHTVSLNVANKETLLRLLTLFDILLEHGADICATDHDGRNALMLICLPYYSWDSRILYRLITKMLDHGLNLHATDAAGNTALHLAVQHTRFPWPEENAMLVRMLAQRGSLSDLENKDGLSPLALAAQGMLVPPLSGQSIVDYLTMARKFWERNYRRYEPLVCCKSTSVPPILLAKWQSFCYSENRLEDTLEADLCH